MRSQIVTAWSNRRNITATPYAFTGQGIAMLSSILNSETAINMNIAIMRAFVSIRTLTHSQIDLKKQPHEIKERLGEHDVQLNGSYDAMDNLMDERIAQRKWDDRERIGFSVITICDDTIKPQPNAAQPTYPSAA